MDQYATACAAAIAHIDEASKSATLKDYFRAQSFREVAQAYAKEADELSAKLAESERIAGSIEQAIAVLDLASADDLRDSGVAYLSEILLKFLADRTAGCTWTSIAAHQVAASLANHLAEACKLGPVPADYPVRQYQRMQVAA